MRQRVWFYDKLILGTGIGALVLAGVFALYAVGNASPSTHVRGGDARPAAANAHSAYAPQTRDLVVTAVPLLVHEQSGFFDYLNKAFAKGGLLRNKEVWAFSPNTLTVYQGDTVRVTVVNPGDDPHTFTIGEVGFSMSVPGQTQKQGTFVVPSAGLYKFYCAIPEHTPYMWGNLVVFPDSDAPQA
jgi:plastocyanin